MGHGSWQASLETFSWAFAARRSWPQLDAEARARVRGFEARIDSVVMSPRPEYGPTAYRVEVSNDRKLWREVAAEPAAADGLMTSTFEPVGARHVRLVISGGYAWMQPPRNVQVVTLEVATLEVDAAP